MADTPALSGNQTLLTSLQQISVQLGSLIKQVTTGNADASDSLAATLTRIQHQFYGL